MAAASHRHLAAALQNRCKTTAGLVAPWQAVGVGLGELRIRLLGGLAVEGVPERDLGSRKARTLIKVLALARGKPVAVERIADVLWGDALPARPGDQVGVLISRLRGVLGPDRLLRSDAGYALRVDWLDLDELGARADEAAVRLAAGQFAAARAAADAALNVAHGPLLPDEDGEWVDTGRTATARAVAAVRRTLAAAAAALGDHGAAASAAEVALDHDPYDEAALRLLMRAHVAAARPASALAAYARVRERLAEDLGVSPAAATEALHTSILRGEEIPAEHPGPGSGEKPSSLVGRDAELDRLDGLLQQAATGRRQAIVIEGEAGIGKSTLVRAFAARAAAAGSVVLVGRCDALGRDLPLQPVLDALDAYLAPLGEAAAGVLGPEGAVLRPLLWGHPPGPAGPTVMGDAASGQAVLFAALGAVLDRLSEGGGPVVLLIEDIQLAAPATLEWLGLAARKGRRLLVVATRRPEGLTLEGVNVLALGPLDLDAATALVGQDRAADLHARSGGHPLFLVELAHAGSGELPSSIRQAVAERADRLGEDAGATLRAAASLGPELDLDLLAAVLGTGLGELLSHLEAALAARLLAERDGVLRFAHELVREALAEATTAPRRAWLHREAASVLAARPRADPLAVAWHARRGGDSPAAAAALGAAAALSADRFELAEAERLLDDALGLHDTGSLRLARARVRLARLDLAGATADADAALAAGAGVEGLELAGWVAYYRRDHDTARRYADEAVARSDDPALRASCLALAGRHRHSRGELTESEACLVQAADGPAPVRAAAQVWLGALRIHQGRVQEAADLASRALLDPGAIGHPFAPLHGLFVRTYSAGLAGRLDVAFDSATQLGAVVADQGQHAARFQPIVLNMRGWLLGTAGQWSAAADAAEEALELAAEVGFGEPGAHALLDLAENRLRAGDRAGAAERLEQAAAIAADDQVSMAWHQRQRVAWLRGRLALAAGDRAAAGTEAAWLTADAVTRGNRRYELLARVLSVLAEGVVEPDSLEPVLAELERIAAPEAWWVTAQLAVAGGVDRWRADAERRLGTLVSSAGKVRDLDGADVGRVLSAELDRLTGPA
jgi:DNA-binding SARP family transcriptional activator